MPKIFDQHNRTEAAAVQQIVLSSSEIDYFNQLVPTINDAGISSKSQRLLQSFDQYSADREAEIEAICNINHQGFVSSVNQLLKAHETSSALMTETFSLNQSIQSSTDTLARQKRDLVDSRGVRQNMDEATGALQDCLEVLRLANQVHDLLARKAYYSALRALDELQTVHLQRITQYKLADMIQKSAPATKRLVADAVMADLNTWLFRVRETSEFLGEVAFYHTEQRRTRQKDRPGKFTALINCQLNSAVVSIADEGEEFDTLDNDDVQVDFTPLFECVHIHDTLDHTEKFKADYAATRLQQKDLLMPTSVSLVDSDGSSLSELLEGIAGFSIVEKATMKKVPKLRSQAEVDGLWDSMCRTAIALISNALVEVTNAELLLKIKGVIALFIQTMSVGLSIVFFAVKESGLMSIQTWGYTVDSLDTFLLTLFDKYAELLKKRFSDDFQEASHYGSPPRFCLLIVLARLFQPMIICQCQSINQTKLRFPCVLPFSQMYPLCCIDIRNFLNQFYFFSDDHFQHPKIIDETLKSSLDELLCQNVCQSLVDRLSTQYLGQIVQILINLEHFEIACEELEQLLLAARSSASAGGPVVLSATEQFRGSKKTAEKRIFELVNSKIDDLIGTAEYNWSVYLLPYLAEFSMFLMDNFEQCLLNYRRNASTPENEPSNYIQTLTRYLSNIMTTVLLGLPTEIKELIYFDALSHAATMILSLPLSSEVKSINPHGVAALSKDVQYLTEFVDTLDNPILKENLDELQQTVSLMQAESCDDFYDVATRNKKYGRVDALNGPVLLEKLTHFVQSPAKADKFTALSSRFGIKS
ncbi:MAG: hypothetical protein L6R37_007731 [Teloschistes peruensis]|nr:MAG: hypothetical protein L6R37_007731 [Teloschistes peruensis]